MANPKVPLINLRNATPDHPQDGNGYLWELALRVLRTYSNGAVNRFMVERSLDFLALVDIWATAKTDKDRSSEPYVTLYDACVADYKPDIATAKAVLRRYGEQNAGDLQSMRDRFYSITNSWRYGRDVRLASPVRSHLSEAWDGIGEWRN